MKIKQFMSLAELCNENFRVHDFTRTIHPDRLATHSQQTSEKKKRKKGNQIEFVSLRSLEKRRSLRKTISAVVKSSRFQKKMFR